MYIREVKTKNKKTGTIYSTYRLVKNERINGVPKQINLISLGKLENVPTKELSNLAKRIEELYYHKNTLFPAVLPDEIEALALFYSQKLIQKDFVERPDKESDNQEYAQEKQFVEVDINSTTGKTSEQIGGEFLCQQAIQELGLDTFLKEELKYTDNQTNNCLISLIGRLLFSCNENQTARWLNDNSAIDELYPTDSAKVNKNQLYSGANQFYKDKSNIEKYLNARIEKIFNLKRKIILYDLTNTHFEGIMANSEKSTFGKNKQKRNDCRQITLALLTDEHGFPLHSQYYNGNISEPSTLEQMLKDLADLHQNLFSSSEKPCIIMDAGIATDDNIKYLLKHNYKYICVSRKSHKDLINKVEAEDVELIKFKNKSDKELSSKLFNQDFEYENIDNKTCTVKESIIYIKSPDKEKKERAIDEKKYKRFEDGLKTIEKTIQNPRGQKSIAKINQRIGRLKEKNKGIAGFFEIELTDDSKEIISIGWKRKEKIPKEKKQGVYFLRTNLAEKEEEKLWSFYRVINEVEDAFGTLKSEIKVRPNFHQSDSTIEAHINLCVLAYYVISFIRYRLKSKNINYSWSEIRRLMSTQKRCIQVTRTKQDKALWTKYCTRPIPEVDKIYQAMNYKKIPFYRKNIIT